LRLVGDIWPFDIDALPSICQAKGCYRDAPKGKRFCDRHEQLHTIQLLQLMPKSKRRTRPPRGVSLRDWVKRPPDNKVYLPTNLYAIRTDAHVKFGVSVKVRDRLKELQTGAAERLRLHGAMPATLKVEKAVHRYLAAERSHGEWFHWRPRVVAVASLIRAGNLHGLLELLDDKDLLAQFAKMAEPPRKPEPTVCRLE
jgi:hypothetical protein